MLVEHVPRAHVVVARGLVDDRPIRVLYGVAHRRSPSGGGTLTTAQTSSVACKAHANHAHLVNGSRGHHPTPGGHGDTSYILDRQRCGQRNVAITIEPPKNGRPPNAELQCQCAGTFPVSYTHL